jgi:single-strand DNA-binding protein
MINKVILVGNLGVDPELRYTQSGTPVASFRVATTERWKGQDGQMQEQTEWHSCNAWGKLAEICGKYLQKGSKVYVEGSINTRKWQDKSGNDRYSTEVKVREMKMLDGKKDSQQSGGEWSSPVPNNNDSNNDSVPF